MNESKRLRFLRSFLKLYDVKRIDVTDESEKHIKGVAIYNVNDFEENQDFIWYKAEHEVPSEDLILIIEKILAEKLHRGDLLYRQVEKVKFTEFEDEFREELINQLLNIDVKMIDDDQETDSYFVHF